MNPQATSEVLDKVNEPRSWKWRRVMAFGCFLHLVLTTTVVLFLNPDLTDPAKTIVLWGAIIDAGVITLFFGNTVIVDSIATFKGLSK